MIQQDKESRRVILVQSCAKEIEQFTSLKDSQSRRQLKPEMGINLQISN